MSYGTPGEKRVATEEAVQSWSQETNVTEIADSMEQRSHSLWASDDGGNCAGGNEAGSAMYRLTDSATGAIARSD